MKNRTRDIENILAANTIEAIRATLDAIEGEKLVAEALPSSAFVGCEAKEMRQTYDRIHAIRAIVSRSKVPTQ